MIDRQYFEEKYPDIVRELRKVYDPEIPLDIFELGLIYDIQLQEDNSVDVVMTLTAPNCPVAGELDPPWMKDFVSEERLMALGM